MNTEPGQCYVFGPFRLQPADKLLLRAGRPVALPPKAVDTLLVLLEHRGHVVQKDDLMRRVWPDTFVDEDNLTQNISKLRRALGDDPEGRVYIETIPRRGYRFVAPVSLRGEESAALMVAERTRSSVTIEEETSDDIPVGERRAAVIVRDRARRLGGPRFWMSASALALALAGAGFYGWRKPVTPKLPFDKQDRVLVLDFENHTGDSRFDRALLTAFTASLEQSRHVNLVAHGRLGPVLKRMGRDSGAAIDEDLGIEIARREGIRAILACGITRTGEQYAISARLIDPQKQVAVWSVVERVHGEDRILDGLDEVASDVRHGLGETLQTVSESSRPLPQVTTSSLDALKAYADGVEVWRRGKYKEGVALYTRAIERDPDFAMAHAALGSAFLSHIFNDPVQGKQHYENALRLRHRITDLEFGRIRASYSSNLGHIAEAIEIYAAHLKLYPDDLTALAGRARLLMVGGRHDECIGAYQQVLRIDPSNAGAWINLAVCQRGLGRNAESLPHYQKAFELEPGWITLANLNHEYGFALVAAGHAKRAREVFTLALATPDMKRRGLRSLALLDMYEGRFAAAAEKLRGAIREEPGREFGVTRARDHLFLASAREIQGNRVEQLRELDRAVESLKQVDPTVWLPCRIGVAYARSGAIQQAVAILEKSRSLLDANDEIQMLDVRRLEAEVALAKGQGARAVELLQSAAPTFSGSHILLVFDSLARALRKTGQGVEAAAAFERLIANPGSLGWEPQQAWLVAHYELAELYVERGEREKAKRLLDELLGLWAQADPDLPLLRQAKRLRGSL